MVSKGLVGFFLLCLVLLTVAPGHGAIFYVDASATGANNGTSWTNAFTTIQAGIDAANALPGGAEVWVKAGTYTGCNSDPISDSFEALNPNAVDVLGEERDLFYTENGTSCDAHLTLIYLTGDRLIAPTPASLGDTTSYDSFLTRLSTLVYENPDVMVILNHPSREGNEVSAESISSAVNAGLLHFMEIKEGEAGRQDVEKWDYALAHLDDQAGDCSKIIWGVRAEDQHYYDKVGGPGNVPIMVGIIPTTREDDVYSDRQLAFKDMMHRGSFVACGPFGSCSVPRYNLESTNGTASKFEITVTASNPQATTTWLRFYGCDWQTGNKPGTLLYETTITQGVPNKVSYYLTQNGISTGTPLTTEQKRNIKYIRPVLFQVVGELDNYTYFQPVRIRGNGDWWNGPNYTLAGRHAVIGASPYPSGTGTDTGETIYFNTHTHTLMSDGNALPQTMRMVFWEKYGQRDPTKPRFCIITDHNTITPFATPARSVIVLKQGARVYGGFQGTETTREQRNWRTNQTIIDAQGNGRCVYSSGSGWSDPTDAVLDGFTIKNGNVGGNNAGAGMYNWKCSPRVSNCVFIYNQAWFGAGMTNSFASPSVTCCNFQDNSAGSTPPWRPGGGMLNEASSAPFIAGCEFTRNIARRGGAICNVSSSPTISMCVFKSNSVNGFSVAAGGAIYNWRASGQITNCTFEANTANAMYGKGGGIYSSDSQFTISLCKFKANQADGSLGAGGAICLYGNPQPATIKNCVFFGNSAKGSGGCGGAVYAYQSNSTNIISNTITQNTAVIGGGLYFETFDATVASNIIAFNSHGIYSIEGSISLSRNNVFGNNQNYYGLSPGPTDISVDPLFVSNDDFHLRFNSPCVNSGDNAVAGNSPSDIDGEPRVYGSKVDIGADEYWPYATSAGPKGLPDGSAVTLNDVVVTASFDNYVYVESKNRAWGIRVNKSVFELPVGVAMDITGIILTDSNTERYVEPTLVQQRAPYTIRPLMTATHSVGGITWCYSAVTGAGQRGVKNGRGLNNIGLLLSIQGLVTGTGQGYFFVDDGAMVDDGWGCLGIKVLGSVPVAPGENAVGKRVRVTGISSCEKLPLYQDPVRVIRSTSVSVVP